MYHKDKRSFFERLTGTINLEDDEVRDEEHEEHSTQRERGMIHHQPPHTVGAQESWENEEEEDGELAVDVYQTDDDIVVQAMIAGVNPDDIDISITRDMVTIKGRRVAPRRIEGGEYFHQELYWGPFSRTILLPEEVEADHAEAVEKHGLLMLKLPKIDKRHTAQVKVRST